MRKLFFFMLLFISACSSRNSDIRGKLSMAGEWTFRIDSLDQGIAERWYAKQAGETIKLPGSMAENGKGDDVTLNTPWTGDIVDKSYFTDKKYEKYRKEGNIKIPFWLKPVKYYKGAAWYQKEFELPESWRKKNVILFLERVHWESTVFVNGKMAGAENSLSVPHEFDITPLLIEGRNTISIRVDNRVVVPIGVNSHSISDHTQSNWNGIAGDISLRAVSPVFIKEVSVFPDISTKNAKVLIELSNTSGSVFRGKVSLEAESFNTDINKKIKGKKIEFIIESPDKQLVVDYPMGADIHFWSEFDTCLYRLSVNLRDQQGEVIDRLDENFGMREFRSDGKRFSINGLPVFLRGTTECCVFPLTGYPPTDAESWEKILRICKSYGLNHLRFHSYCPPEAAFSAADKIGVYFHIECSSWANQGATVGDGGITDKFIYEEGDKILKQYGNHPSFCMLAYGNEPAGENQNKFFKNLLTYWKGKDNRHVYTSAAGWPSIPENDYDLTPEPRIQAWGAGLNSIINAKAPQTLFDFDSIVSRFPRPVVSHEIGQWCVYPDFTEIEKYSGVLKASNLEIFRETLRENAMGDQSDEFLQASGKLQVLCYKADIEAALRTPSFAGFELLQLHDFPGQGTALVGILNPFFESKGYVRPEEFRMFCNSTVPLARMKKLVFSAKETFTADIEFAHFGSAPLKNVTIVTKVYDSDSAVVLNESKIVDDLHVGNCIQTGSVSMNLSKIGKPSKMTLEVSVKDTQIKNNWNFWVYPETESPEYCEVTVTDNLREAESALKSGAKVLLLTNGKIAENKGASIKIGFSSIFWNTAWTNNQPPHTLGILCDSEHGMFNDFPTENHSNWQWWDPVSHSQVMLLDEFPTDFRPLIQPIDTWFENRRLALAFEGRVGEGKILVCSIDLVSKINERPVSKQLLASIINYMNSDSFTPSKEIDLKLIKRLTVDAR